MWMTSKKVGMNQNVAPMWRMIKNVDVDEPTSCLDHVYLGCSQRECKPNETIEQYKKTFESRLKSYQVGKNLTRKEQRGPATWRDMLNNAWSGRLNWQTRKWSNCAKFRIFAWMIISSSRKKLSQLVNSRKFARELS